MPLQKCRGLAIPSGARRDRIAATGRSRQSLICFHLQKRCPANRPWIRLTIRQRPLPPLGIRLAFSLLEWLIALGSSGRNKVLTGDNLHSVGMLSFGGVT